MNETFAVPLADGLVVEAVSYGSGTLCLSTQAGCAVGCSFCASGAKGLIRNLSREEMVLQLETACRGGRVPQRVTLSGIGEPLHNPEAVFAFIDHCRQRNLPVSLTTTATHLDRLEQFLVADHNGLMLSLHAGSATTHRRLIPHGPDFEALWGLLGQALPSLSRRRRRKVGINYLLLEGINDSPEELSCLRSRLLPFAGLTLHLLSCNPVPGSSFRSPSAAAFDAVHDFFRRGGIHVRRANRWRKQRAGGCGTLFVKALDNRLENI